MTGPNTPPPPPGPGRPAEIPLDPDSPEGIAVAKRLTRTLAQIRLNIKARKRAAAQIADAA